MEQEVLTTTTEYKPSKALTTAFDWVASAVLALILLVVTFAVFFRLVNVEGRSMESTLHSGDSLIISNFFYTPEYGDIVVIRRDNNTPLIKRVIGLPGDVIQIDNDKKIVLRNGEAIEESYLEGNITQQQATGMSRAITVKEGEIYVLGDNRVDSHDSRNDGCYSMRNLVGRVLLRVSPEFGEVE